MTFLMILKINSSNTDWSKKRRCLPRPLKSQKHEAHKAFPLSDTVLSPRITRTCLVFTCRSQPNSILSPPVYPHTHNLTYAHMHLQCVCFPVLWSQQALTMKQSSPLNHPDTAAHLINLFQTHTECTQTSSTRCAACMHTCEQKCRPI